MTQRVSRWLWGRGEAFLRWWGRELAQLLPSSLRFGALVGRQQVRLSYSDQGWRVERLDGTRCVEDVLISHAGAEPTREPWPLSPSDSVVLVVPDDWVLRKVVHLPSATEENLAQVLGYELDRLTPFHADQVYFDFRLLERRRRSQQLEVALLLCPREKLDPTLLALGDLGVRIEQATVQEAHGQELADFNLLPKQLRNGGWPASRLVNLGLSVVMLGMLVIWLGLPIYQQRLQINDLLPVLRDARGQAEETLRLRKELEALEADVTFLTERQRSSVRMLDVLNELTTILPDDTWVQQLQIQGQEVVMQGKSAEAAMALGVLEGSPLLEEVRFRSPVTADPREGTERFHLSAQLVGGGKP